MEYVIRVGDCGSKSESGSNYETEGEYDMCSGGNYSRRVSGGVNQTSSSTYSGKRQVSFDGTVGLPFDPSCLENVILTISDKFDFRVVLRESRTAGALLVTAAGLAVAGSLLGHRCGGNVGAAVGGAVGGACGVGLIALSMRDIWEDVKPKLWDLYDMVYDYLAGLGVEDYKAAATFLASNGTQSTQLAMLMLSVGSQLLGKKILSSLTAAA